MTGARWLGGQTSDRAFPRVTLTSIQSAEMISTRLHLETIYDNTHLMANWSLLILLQF